MLSFCAVDRTQAMGPRFSTFHAHSHINVLGDDFGSILQPHSTIAEFLGPHLPTPLFPPNLSHTSRPRPTLTKTIACTLHLPHTQALASPNDPGPPPWVPTKERERLEGPVEEWATALQTSAPDKSLLRKPLRCVWAPEKGLDPLPCLATLQETCTPLLLVHCPRPKAPIVDVVVEAMAGPPLLPPLATSTTPTTIANPSHPGHRA